MSEKDRKVLHKPTKMPQSDWDMLVANIHSKYGYGDGTWGKRKIKQLLKRNHNK